MAIEAPRRNARRRAILDAALSVFLERGVSGASIEEIRQRSGASVGSLYHRFGSKEGIAAAVYIDALADYQQAFARALDRDRSTEATIKAVVGEHLRWVQRNADRAQYLFMGRDADVRLAVRDELRDLNADFFGRVLAWLRPRIEAHEICDAPVDVLHALWLGPSQELSRHWLAGGRRGRLSPHAALLADAAWRSLAARPAS